jgi:signal transduction histidine kinase
VEAGKMELALSDFDLKELLKNSFSFVMDKMNERGLYYCCEIGDGVGSVRADERKIKQVIFNLLSNAVKFTPQGGKIVLGADKKNESEILVFVRDNGIGVEAKDRDKIFSEFAQIDSEFSRKYAGTGLGMPLSRKFIELHGGRLWFESEGQGKGTTFYFTVPVTQPVSA